MNIALGAKFQLDSAWKSYFRLYGKDLQKIKDRIRFQQESHFNCTRCGKCCDFIVQQHRCLLSWADVARWYDAGFYLGLFFVFPAHSIDGYSALGIPTKKEVRSGKFIEWIRLFDVNGQVQAKFPHFLEKLTRSLGDAAATKDMNGNCIYLGSHNRCLIHQIRPGACRMFPYLQTKIIQAFTNAIDNNDGETDVPCPPEAFTPEGTAPEDKQLLLSECAEAEAAAWAQERVSLPEVENLLVEIWREILPKF